MRCCDCMFLCQVLRSDYPWQKSALCPNVHWCCFPLVWPCSQCCKQEIIIAPVLPDFVAFFIKCSVMSDNCPWLWLFLVCVVWHVQVALLTSVCTVSILSPNKSFWWTFFGLCFLYISFHQDKVGDACKVVIYIYIHSVLGSINSMVLKLLYKITCTVINGRS